MKCEASLSLERFGVSQISCEARQVKIKKELIISKYGIIYFI
jgi:hypothetical protein